MKKSERSYYLAFAFFIILKAFVNIQFRHLVRRAHHRVTSSLYLGMFAR